MRAMSPCDGIASQMPSITKYLMDKQKSAYRGVMTEAFISGLSDGTYLFHVRAFDNAGSIIATAKPTTVLVHHWPVSYAIALFTIGFAVVMGVIVVIVRGAIAPTSPAGDR